MLQRTFSLSTEQISKETSYYTIGFATLSEKENVEDAVSAGSGSLVTVGALYGVLTAAHVIDKLPSSGKVGVVLNATTPEQFQKQTITMEHTEKVLMRADEFGPKGPDLGFLKLAEADVGWLKAKNSFYNLMKRRDDVLGGKVPSASYSDVIAGAIHEMTKDAPSEKPGTRRKIFTVIFCGARQTAVRYFDDYELIYFEPTSDPGAPMPKSFEGTSGGALWRFYVTAKDDKTEVIERRLLGVPFFQAPSGDGKTSITCHGSKGIYGPLIDKIIARWPTEAKA